MNVQELYQQKLTTAEEAVKIVKSGDWVDYGWCCNQPVALDKALAARKDELFDVKIHGGVTMWMPEVCKADDAGDHFTWNSWHCSGLDRKIIGKGMGYFGPMRYSELPRFYRDGNATTDVAMIQVTPMDAHGNFSFAVSASHIGDMLEHAKKIIVEVNQNMPWVYGLTGTEINIRDVDHGRGRREPRRGRYGRRRSSHRCGPQGCRDDREGDPQRRLPAAGHRRPAGRHSGISKGQKTSGDPLGGPLRRHHRPL